MNDDLRMDANERITQNTKRPRRRLRRYFVLLVVVGFVALAIYAFSQGQQMGISQVTPVIKADGESFKVRPDQPGGLEIPHQDKLVYDQLEGHGIESKVERLVPPPEKPMQSTATAIEQSAPVNPAPQAGTTPGGDEDEMPPEKLTPLPQQNVAAKPVPDIKPAVPIVTPKPEAKKPVEQAAAAKPLTPKTENHTPAAKAEAGIAKVASMPAAAAGEFKIQLAAFPDEATARKKVADWDKQFAGILGKHSLSVVKADIPQKGVFYRIQVVGFPDRDSAKILCDKFKAESQGCMVVK